MKRFQLVMRGGLTRNIEADTYRREHNDKLVFRTAGKVVGIFKTSEVLMVDECGEVMAGAGSMED